ncbi:MAG: hypothetical protein M3R55_11690 [Acidobacteriota bacterium]|nr:hypothetical protein [Acidobacteriota bacterium]
MTIKDWFTRPGVESVTAPVIIQQNGTDIVVAATRHGRIVLLDAAALGGADHATPLAASARLTSGAATFFSAHSSDMAGQRHALAVDANSTGALQALTVNEQDGALSVQPG